ncbi:MAG: hypothetical protein P4N59_29730 [Negativicutes bacterium]|nr:hypothetical protein [Negativicutes bacterium]
MIVVKRPRNPEDSEYFQIDVVNGILAVTYLTAVEGSRAPFTDEDFTAAASTSVVLNDSFAPNSMYSLYFTVMGGFYWSESFSFLSSRDGGSPLRQFYNVDTKKAPALELFFVDSVDEYVLVSYYPMATRAADALDRPNSEVFFATVAALYPQTVPLFTKFKARRAVVSSLDPNDSIAALESQVDILSQLVFSLLDAMPDCCGAAKVAFPQLDQFKAAVQATSVLTVKGAAVAIPELRAKKQQVRTLQQAYFAEKGGPGA